MDTNDQLMQQAQLDKLKELRKVIREILAKEGDGEMDAERVEEALEEADDATLAEPEGAEMDDDEMVREGTEEEMAEPDGLAAAEEEDELTRMKREYFQPKQKTKDPAGVQIAMLAPPKRGFGDEIKLPRRALGKKGLV